MAMKSHDPATPRGKIAIVDAMMPLIQLIPDQLALNDYIRQLSERMGTEVTPCVRQSAGG